MSTLSPLQSSFPFKPVKFVAPLRGGKVDSVPIDGEYLGLEQLESWSGNLSGVELQQPPEGGANVFEQGDVLFGKLRPYLAKGWVADRAGYCTTESLVLQPTVDPRFVRYCLLTHEVVSAIDGSTYGSKMPRADWGFIGSVQLPCPSAPEQESIANFLDEQTARIDALIAAKEELLAILASARQAHAFSLSTNGIASERPYLVRPEPWLQTVSAHWTVPKLGYIAEVGNGSTPRREIAEYWLDGTVPWITSTVIHGGAIESTEEEITEQALRECHLRMIRPGSTIVGLIGQGPTRGMAARLGIAATLSQNVAFATARKEADVEDEYLTVALTGLYSAMRYLSDGVGGAHGAMNCDQLRALRIPLPPRREQVKIVIEFRKREAAIDEMRSHAAIHVALLREYRLSLISAAVTGQLDISTFKAAE